MALRTQTAACCLILLALPLSAELTYRVRHEHLRKGCTGELRVDEQGVSFREINPKKKHPHAFQWPYTEIQQLTIAPEEIRVLTYQDNHWKLGADREHRFALIAEVRGHSGLGPSKDSPEDHGRGVPGSQEAFAFLKNRLDQRLVVQLAEPTAGVLWQMPVKHLTRFGGSQGVLIAAADRLIYRTDRRGESRTWRFQDLENVSTSGPFQLTVTTYERARSHYGSLKGFNFQLKQPLSEDRYNDLWRRLHPPALPALAAGGAVAPARP